MSVITRNTVDSMRRPEAMLFEAAGIDALPQPRFAPIGTT